MNIEIVPMNLDSNDAELAREFAKMREYPEDYKGPRAGQSTHEEWIAVRDFDAFKYVRDSTWSYADFDCYLYAMCEEHYKKGGDAVHNALTEMQKITGIRP